MSNPNAEMRAEVEGLLKEQFALMGKLKAAWAKLPPEPIENYRLTDSSGAAVMLADLFGEHERLLVVHNMGFACPYCTIWADGFSSTDYFYAQNGVGFVLTSPDSPEKQREGQAKRGWTFPLVSTQGTSFAKDLNMENEEGVWPGISALVKRADGSIQRTAWNYFGPGDQYCAVFHFLDFFPAKDAAAKS